MSLRKETPCDFGPCPYDAEYSSTCDYYCSAEEPNEDWMDYELEQMEQENLREWEVHEEIRRECEEFDDCDYEVGFDPYLGCYTDDC